MSTVNEEYLVSTTSTVILINIICIIIAAIHNAALLFKAVYDNKVRKELNDGHEFQLRLYYLTIATILSYIIMNISFLFTEFNWLSPNIQCKMILISIGYYYFVPKYLGWIYQIIRLKIVFYDSPLFAYNRCFLNLIQAGLLLAPIIITLFMIFFSYSIYDPTLSHCDLITPLWLGAFCGGIDGFASFFCISLFYFKMKKLLTNISKVNKKDKKAKKTADHTIMLWYVTRKFTILSSSVNNYVNELASQYLSICIQAVSF